MSQKLPYSKALVTVLAFAMFAVGCTKSRDAELPYEMQKSVFAISEFGETQTENTQYSVATDDSVSQLSLGNASKATAEKGVVALDTVKVPSRLKYMFSGLEITGLTDHTYPITFSVDKQFVTAYKIVNNPDELTILEKQLAQVQDEVVLQKQLQKNDDRAKAKALLASLQKARDSKVQLLSQKSGAGALLIPLFKYKIAKFGVLQKQKNKLNEDTSTLDLTETDWSQATHIVLNTTKEGRLPVGLDPSQSGDLDRTFVMDRINNKIMTAGTLTSEFQIPLNLAQDARVLTLLDTKSLHVFEITQSGKADLTDSQRRQLQNGGTGNVRSCPADVVKALPADAQADCILILRYDVDVTYVRPELPVVDYDGNQDSKLNFKPVLAGQNIGLVQIPKDTEPKKVESNNELDPNTTVRIIDIKDKEFFFKRTMEDAPETVPFEAGMSGNLTIVKFELEESRLVVRKADRLVDFKRGSNETSYEEMMSIPITYKKRELKDASGTPYAIPRIVPATRTDAEYVELDWTRNTLSSDFSPYEVLAEGCIRSVADTKVKDVDMRLDKGVLNFSFDYSVGLNAGCIIPYSVNDYNGTASYSTTARVKERISFKFNDGSTNAPFAPQVPFKIQNDLGYGVWTIGKLNPTDQGIYGRDGQENSIPVVQDFRNGKKLLYTVTGLENRNGEIDPELRKMYIEAIGEIVNGWDLAYRQAFKGTRFERAERYVEFQVAGENGIEAHVGDLDRNIIHFENKVNDNTGSLGVSQVGYNPRSGIVVADQLIVYAGNLQKFVATYQRNMKIAQDWADKKKAFREQALAKLAEKQKAADEGKKAEAKGATATPEQTAAAANQISSTMLKLARGQKANMSAVMNLRNLSQMKSIAQKTVSDIKAVGGSGSFQYSPSAMESSWVEKVIRQLSQTPNLDNAELTGLVAQEMLNAKAQSLSDMDKARLQRVVTFGQMRSKMNASMKSSPGCRLSSDAPLGRQFTAASFKDAMKIMLMFDLGHEMGHSQGLTHNFIGSFDKANFTNEDGSASKRNYSSIMDYFQPGGFNWDGIGTYDIHALRASHLGLLEATPEYVQQSGGKGIVNGKYLSVFDILGKRDPKDTSTSWNNFSIRQIPGVLKPYKYCTDIHVGYEPVCQRFDTGTSAVEIVTNMIAEYENAYVNNYHSWDRNNFGIDVASAAAGNSVMNMFEMRQFMDELFFKLVTGSASSQEEISDYAQASVKIYLFFIQLIKTPDANNLFQDPARFMAVPYTYTVKGADGQPKEVQDVEVVEKRALQTLAIRQDRVDTIGIEQDKLMAMNFLTMKGFPAYKYRSNSIEFSFVDFEKLLGMTPDTSIYMNTITGIMLNQLQPSFTNDKANLSPISDATASVTSAMRAYAGIFSILNLESSTLRGEDNFANMFKVGASLGKSLKDRVSLSQLGVSNTSAVRLSYWANDNAVAANNIINVAAAKNAFIQKTPQIQPSMEKLAAAQLNALLAKNQAKDVADKAAADAAKVKAETLAKLNDLNKNGELVSAELLKQNPNLTIENQLNAIVSLNDQLIQAAFTLILRPDMADQLQPLVANASQLADNLPLFAIAQKGLVASLDKAGEEFAKNEKTQGLADLGQAAKKVTNGDALELSYGIIMKNVEFLNTLSAMTNPELRAK